MPRSLQHLDKTGAVVITAKDWGDILAGTVTAAEKFWVANDGDVALGEAPLAFIAQLQQVGDSDGVTRVAWGLDVDSIGPPFTVAAAPGGAGGVWAAPGLYYYRLTALKAGGETQGSREIGVSVVDQAAVMALTWALPAGATGVKVYRSITPGGYAGSTLVATLGAVTAYGDTGAAPSAGGLPTENTTGGAGPAYGTPPALSAADLSIGMLPVGAARAYWMQLTIPLASSEEGNDRMSRRHFAEV